MKVVPDSVGKQQKRMRTFHNVTATAAAAATTTKCNDNASSRAQQQQEEPADEESSIFLDTLHDNDVLSPRGSNDQSATSRIGNQRYQEVLQQFHVLYQEARSDHERLDVAKRVIVDFQSRFPPGRFVKRLDGGSRSRGHRYQRLLDFSIVQKVTRALERQKKAKAQQVQTRHHQGARSPPLQQRTPSEQPQDLMMGPSPRKRRRVSRFSHEPPTTDKAAMTVATLSTRQAQRSHENRRNTFLQAKQSTANATAGLKPTSANVRTKPNPSRRRRALASSSKVLPPAKPRYDMTTIRHSTREKTTKRYSPRQEAYTQTGTKRASSRTALAYVLGERSQQVKILPLALAQPVRRAPQTFTSAATSFPPPRGVSPPELLAPSALSRSPLKAAPMAPVVESDDDVDNGVSVANQSLPGLDSEYDAAREHTAGNAPLGNENLGRGVHPFELLLYASELCK